MIASQTYRESLVPNGSLQVFASAKVLSALALRYGELLVRRKEALLLRIMNGGAR